MNVVGFDTPMGLKAADPFAKSGMPLDYFHCKTTFTPTVSSIAGKIK
jgi:hypothetical protein